MEAEALFRLMSLIAALVIVVGAYAAHRRNNRKNKD